MFWSKTQTQPPKVEPYISWMNDRHLDACAAIELLSCAQPLSRDAINEIRHNTNYVCMVARIDDVVVGYMVYWLEKSSLNLSRIVVHPNYRRQGIGTQFIDKLVSKLSYERRHTLHCIVPESNLAAQLFLRATGLRAVGVERDACGNEDGYRFRFSVKE